MAALVSYSTYGMQPPPDDFSMLTVPSIPASLIAKAEISSELAVRELFTSLSMAARELFTSLSMAALVASNATVDALI